MVEVDVPATSVKRHEIRLISISVTRHWFFPPECHLEWSNVSRNSILEKTKMGVEWGETSKTTLMGFITVRGESRYFLFSIFIWHCRPMYLSRGALSFIHTCLRLMNTPH